MIKPLHTIPDQSAIIDPGIFRKERPELLCVLSAPEAFEGFYLLLPNLCLTDPAELPALFHGHVIFVSAADHIRLLPWQTVHTLP